MNLQRKRQRLRSKRRPEIPGFKREKPGTSAEGIVQKYAKIRQNIATGLTPPKLKPRQQISEINVLWDFFLKCNKKKRCKHFVFLVLLFPPQQRARSLHTLWLDLEVPQCQASISAREGIPAPFYLEPKRGGYFQEQADHLHFLFQGFTT